MTVKELIEKLSKMDPDTIVVRHDYSHQLVDIKNVFDEVVNEKSSVGYYYRTNESDSKHIHVCEIY